MKTIYLHIGTPKTGTTFIQEFLDKNNRILKQHGFIYPDFGTTFSNAARERNAHFLVVKEKCSEKLYKDAIKIILKLSRKYDNIILTDEGLWKKDNHISSFVEDMNKHNIQVKIIVYLRRQDLFLQSLWAQKVKTGLGEDFKQYLQRRTDKLDYYKQCCVLREIVGEKNLIVRIYEKQQFEDNDLLKDFLKTIDLIYDERFVIEKDLVNLSLTGAYLETKLMLNRYPQFRNRRDLTVKYLQQLQKENGKNLSYKENKWFTKKEQKELLAKYEEGNKKLAKEFLGREDGILFKDQITDNEYENIDEQVDMSKQYIDILIGVIIKQKQKIKELNEKRLITKIKKNPIVQKIRAIIWKMNL